jgi:hypothetical protein
MSPHRIQPSLKFVCLHPSEDVGYGATQGDSVRRFLRMNVRVHIRSLNWTIYIKTKGLHHIDEKTMVPPGNDGVTKKQFIHLVKI